MPWGSGLGVATHPVAQLKQEDNPVLPSLQSTHRPRSPRTHSFHTIYDGDGRRIKKHVPSTGEVTVFVYDAAGKSIAEYSTQVSQDPKVSYTTSDHLGSPRILTDENGSVNSRRDFHPFGEETFTPHRVQGLGYQPDDVRQKFTGYERDNESELDFAQARNYETAQGRFTSPDPYLPSAVIAVPQSWNRFAYVLNRPFTYVDPTGEDWVKTTDQNNPYKWVDKCADGQSDCYKVVSANVGSSLRVYGSMNEKDITNYQANKSGMVDMRDVAKHHDAQFVVKPGTSEPFLNARTGSSLFNVAHAYRQINGDDQKLFMTAGSKEDGTKASIHKGKYSHVNGNNIDLRYMGVDGKQIQDSRAVELADVERTKIIMKLFKEQNAGTDYVITGNPERFGLPDLQSQSLKNAHRDHMHVQRTTPAPKRPGRK